MSKLLILVRTLGSDGSTFARYFLRTEDNWVHVNRNDFRLVQLGDSLMIPFCEKRVSKMVDASILALLESSTDVLIDATNTSLRTIQGMVSTHTEYADISSRVFDILIEELVKRCDKRFTETGKFIPKGVIERNVNNLHHTLEKFNFEPIPQGVKAPEAVYITQDESLPRAVTCDLDGTPSLLNGRDPYSATTCDNDLLNTPIASVLQMAKAQGYKIVLLPGRKNKYREPTLRFLAKHQMDYDLLLMRTTNDFHRDDIIKHELFEQGIQGKYFINFLLNDRNQVVNMQREDLHLPCLQVNYDDF